MTTPVAIQGIKGSFHHEVALNYFGAEVAVTECLTFNDAVDCILQSKSEATVMALENSIAGSIIPNYALINTHNLQITGEYYLDIQHQLMALKGTSINAIEEVHSHPMALLQCKTFFKQYPHIKLVEAKDTALVAKQISEDKIKGIAAIASQKAAQMYGLDILAQSIQTIAHNETRFVIVKQKPNTEQLHTYNKASLTFQLDHKRGSLAALLNVMSDCKLNLTKIQSLPIIETPWKYAFFVDVTFEAYTQFEKAHKIIQIMAQQFKTLGVYKNARL